MVVGQPADLSKVMCLYAGTDWLICHSEGARCQLHQQYRISGRDRVTYQTRIAHSFSAAW